jgi:hypothetical protein
MKRQLRIPADVSINYKIQNAIYNNMKEKEYRIIIHSIFRFIIAMAVILCSSVILIDKYTPRIQNEFISILQFAAILFISIYLAQIISRAKAKVILSQEGFLHIWERKFFFSLEKNLNIAWDNIESYVFQEDRTFDSFIINLTTKQRYKINRLNFIPINDDFRSFISDFPKLSNEFLKGETSNHKCRIKEGETIYEGKAFKWILYFMTVGFLALLVAKILNPDSSSSWGSLGVIGSGILFYGTMALRKRKNN